MYFNQVICVTTSHKFKTILWCMEGLLVITKLKTMLAPFQTLSSQIASRNRCVRCPPTILIEKKYLFTGSVSCRRLWESLLLWSYDHIVVSFHERSCHRSYFFTPTFFLATPILWLASLYVSFFFICVWVSKKPWSWSLPGLPRISSLFSFRLSILFVYLNLWILLKLCCFPCKTRMFTF